MGFGSIGTDAKGERAFYGDEAPVSLPRARSEQLFSKDRGAGGDASGDDDPLVGLSREALPLMTSQTTEKGGFD